MGFISIHDTHKLPYFNATITAKTKQSGNTSPLKFKSCLDGTELGYTIYTNARGYLCDHDGNLYTDSVCVGEDAYITATMPDGASTSWIVRYESDITVNDGMLLGRTVTDSERQSLTGKTFVKVEGVWRILLHSANTDKDRTLPLGDLDEVPPINEWKEVQEVVRFNLSFTSYDIGEYAKSLVIQWDGSLPTYPAVKTLTLGYENANNRKRYAQQVMVYNDTDMRVTLRDKKSGNIICSINPKATTDIGLFFVESSEYGSWLALDDILMMKANDHTHYINNTGSSIVITDRTPDVMFIRVNPNATPNSITFTDSMTTVTLTPHQTQLRLSRRIKVWWQGTGCLLVKQGTDEKFLVKPYSCAEMYVDAVAKAITPLSNYLPPLYDGSGMIEFTAATNVAVNVPRRCDRLHLTTSQLNTNHYSTLVMRTDVSQRVTLTITNNTSKPIGYAVTTSSASNAAFWVLVTPNSSYSCVIQNDYGILTCPTASPNGVITEEAVPKASGTNWWFVRYPSGIYGGEKYPVNCSPWHWAQVLGYNIGRGDNDDDDIGLMLPIPKGATIKDLTLLVKNYQKDVGKPDIRVSLHTYDHNVDNVSGTFDLPTDSAGITLANMYRFNPGSAPENGPITIGEPGIV
jgi:hypothetical protein